MQVAARGRDGCCCRSPRRIAGSRRCRRPHGRIVALLAFSVGGALRVLATTSPLLHALAGERRSSIEAILRGCSRCRTSALSSGCCRIRSCSSRSSPVRSRRAGGPTRSWLRGAVHPLRHAACCDTASGASGVGAPAQRASRTKRRPRSAPGSSIRRWLGASARHDEPDHAMVGGRAVSVDRAALPLSADLRGRLRQPALLPPHGLARLPGAGAADAFSPRGQIPPIFSFRSASIRPHVRRLHDLPCRNGALAANARRLPAFYMAIAFGGAWAAFSWRSSRRSSSATIGSTRWSSPSSGLSRCGSFCFRERARGAGNGRPSPPLACSLGRSRGAALGVSGEATSSSGRATSMASSRSSRPMSAIR